MDNRKLFIDSHFEYFVRGLLVKLSSPNADEVNKVWKDLLATNIDIKQTSSDANDDLIKLKKNLFALENNDALLKLFELTMSQIEQAPNNDARQKIIKGSLLTPEYTKVPVNIFSQLQPGEGDYKIYCYLEEQNGQKTMVYKRRTLGNEIIVDKIALSVNQALFCKQTVDCLLSRGHIDKAEVLGSRICDFVATQQNEVDAALKFFVKLFDELAEGFSSKKDEFIAEISKVWKVNK